jgi:hypothetical protein
MITYFGDYTNDDLLKRYYEISLIAEKITETNFLINNTIPMTLEKLLNILCEKGWKPFGHEYVSAEHLEGLVRFYYEDKKSCIETLRTMTSKESNLWQFVCENRMIDNLCETRYWRNYFELDEIEYNQPDYQYWVIESSLKDESELEDFLLSNIKVE